MWCAYVGFWFSVYTLLCGFDKLVLDLCVCFFFVFARRKARFGRTEYTKRSGGALGGDGKLTKPVAVAGRSNKHTHITYNTTYMLQMRERERVSECGIEIRE